jgi:hypothetical protein
MVYRGRLSKACLPCRQRKPVCDLKEQGCSSCRRAKLICHGYRDTEALRVTDESSTVQQKVQGSSSTSSNSKPKALPPRFQSHALVPSFRHIEAIPQSVVIPICVQAKDLFYYNYVVGTLKPFDFLQYLYFSTSEDGHLTASMDAVALAYFNYQRRASNAQIEARQHYITALRLMNKAIRDPELAKKDSTMIAILLLDLYEKITNKEPHCEGAWTSHLQGALALAKMRGDEQFDDPTTLRILLRLSTNEIINCVVSHRPVQQEIVALRVNIAHRIGNLADAKSTESDLMIEFAKLRYEIENRGLPDDKALCSLKALDNKFLELSVDIQKTCQFKTVQLSKRSIHHWESYHHIYPYEQIGQVWNVLRLTRILLNELILTRCLGIKGVNGPNFKNALRQQASEIIASMTSEICATVPQYIRGQSADDVPNLTLTLATMPATPRVPPGTPQGASNPTNYLPCYRLIFPLYVAAQSSTGCPELRLWVIDQLRFMADYHSIQKAAQVAEILQLGENRNPWAVYIMLGSYAFVC